MKANIQQRKLLLIENLVRTNDIKIIKEVEEVLQKQDWWDDLPEAAKSSIKRGEEDIKKGRIKSHKEVMKKYKKWLQK